MISRPTMSSNQEEEVLGKAYDGRLMRRLLTYLRPYKWYVAVALAAIVGSIVMMYAYVFPRLVPQAIIPGH